MKQYIKVIFPALASLALLSCKKYLDKKSNAELVVPTTLADLQGLLDDAKLMNLATPSLAESSSDDFFMSDNAYNALISREQETYTWALKDYNFVTDWSAPYNIVYNANLCLERLAKIPQTPTNLQEWNNIKGSALFYRAASFLNLSWSFSKAFDEATSATDPGIALRLQSDFNIPSTRASVKDSYDRILSDTKEAALLLPDYGIHVMRPSKAAAYGLLARTYLSMRQYDSCLKYADLCLHLKNELIDLNGDAAINGSINGSVPFKKFNKEIIFYTEMNRYSTLHMFYKGFVDSSLFASYDDGDLRRQAYFMSSGGFHTFKGSYAASRNILFTGIATDEMYLTRAECFARSGKISEAMDDLNTLLEKKWSAGSFTPVVATDQLDAIQKVLTERRKELIFRGLRWMDVKRLNKEEVNITFKRIVDGQIFTLPPNDNRWALPLPDDIIKLTDMQQN